MMSTLFWIRSWVKHIYENMHFFAYIISYVMWGVWRLAGGEILPPGLAASFIFDTAVKATIWLLPLLFLLQKENKSWIISPKGMFFGTFPWLPTFIGLCLATAFLHTMHIFMVGIHVWGIFQPIQILFALSAAVIEEFAFRGLLFNRQAAVYGVGWASVFNGILFAVYHFPGFLVGQQLEALIGFRFWMIAVMGFIFSLAFARWKHLGMTMVIHFIWNLLCYWFVLT